MNSSTCGGMSFLNGLVQYKDQLEGESIIALRFYTGLGGDMQAHIPQCHRKDVT